VIEAEKAIYTVSRMCELLEVSRSGFYKWRKSRDDGPSPSQQRRAELDAQVADFHAASDGVYGAPRILADLRAAGARPRCAVKGWPGSARGDSRRPPRWWTWMHRYRPTW
jgi:hypothetical protein